MKRSVAMRPVPGQNETTTSDWVDLGGEVVPAFELIYDLGPAALRSQWDEIDPDLELCPVRPGVGDWASAYLAFRESEPAVVALPAEAVGGPDGVEPGVLHDNPLGRLRAMDRRGVRAQVVHPGGSIDAGAQREAEAAGTVLESYNAYILWYCSAAPDRLRSVVQVHCGDPHRAAAEIRDRTQDASVAGVTVHIPVKVAPDDRRFSPVWQAIEESGLPWIHRPGAVPATWTVPRTLTYLALSGVLERFPRLRMAFVGADIGRLCRWLREGQPDRIARVLPYFEAGRALIALPSATDPSVVEELADTIGMPSLGWASGFPLREQWGGSAGAPFPGLRPEVRQRILGRNGSAWLA